MGKSAIDQVRNLFYVGAYQAVLTTLASAAHTADPQEAQLCQVYKVRAQIAMGSSLSAADLAQLPGDAVQLLKWQEQVSSATAVNNSVDFDQLYAELKSVNVSSSLVAVLVAELYVGVLGRVGEAFDILTPFVGEDLECGCLVVQCLLKLNRVDLAERQALSAMKLSNGSAADMDMPIIQLAEASILIAKGRDGCQDAFYIYQELLETFGMTSKLLTCQAVALMASLRFDEAERLLNDALSKNPHDADALANMFTCSLQLKRSAEVCDKLFSRLQSQAPTHPLIRDSELKSVLFDQTCLQFAK